MTLRKLRCSGRPTPSTRVSARRQERGSVLTEFIMVAPIMLLIAGSALRFYQELQAQELGITFAREIATLAYNRCVDKTITKLARTTGTNQDSVVVDEIETPKEIQKCLQEVSNQFQTSWNNAQPIAAAGTTITITVEAHRCSITEITPTNCTSPYIVRVGPQPSPSAPALTLFRNRLTFAKVQFVMTPLATFITPIQPRTISYEATV